MVLNTTRGAVEIPRGTRERVVNTSDVLEPPQMQYVDDPPEIVHVLNAAGWYGTFEDGHQEELLFWCVLDEDTVHGVVLGEDGLVNLNKDNIETRPGFAGYEQATQEKE